MTSDLHLAAQDEACARFYCGASSRAEFIRTLGSLGYDHRDASDLADVIEELRNTETSEG